jgi:glycine betaine transporter
VLMLAGGLTALQNTVIVASLPFLVIIAGLAVSFWKELAADRRAPAARDRDAEPVVEPIVEPTAQESRGTTHVGQ